MNDSLIDGLEKAKELLKDKVPVIYAWEAIKALERVLEYMLSEPKGGEYDV